MLQGKGDAFACPESLGVLVPKRALGWSGDAQRRVSLFPLVTRGMSLPMAIGEHAQPSLFEDEVYNSRYCFV